MRNKANKSLHTNRRPGGPLPKRPVHPSQIRCWRTVPAAVGELCRWAVMRTFIFISTSLVAALVASGCHSPSRNREVPVTPVTSQVPESKLFISQTVRWPVPADLPTFGTPTPNSIRVAVFGMGGTVRRPGYYHLPRGAVVRDAVDAAQGLGDFTWWRNYSGIERPRSEGSFEVIRFTRNRTAEEQILLQDGDRIYFGHVVD